MPRFFFHHIDGVHDLDNEGTEFPDLATARTAAVHYAAESAKDRPDGVWAGNPFRVEVSDEDGTLLCTIVIIGLDAPASRGLRKSQRPAG